MLWLKLSSLETMQSFLVSINSTSEEVLWHGPKPPSEEDKKFPLIPLPKKCCDQILSKHKHMKTKVSINSTSEEVLWLTPIAGECSYRLFRMFPLIPLPKKCCDPNTGKGFAKCYQVSINSTSEEVLWHSGLLTAKQGAVSINSTSEEVLWRHRIIVSSTPKGGFH